MRKLRGCLLRLGSPDVPRADKSARFSVSEA